MDNASEIEAKPIVRFMPSGKDVAVEKDTTLVDAAAIAHLPFGSLCEGELMCGMCRITVIAGGHNLIPISPEERRTLAAIHADPDERLACLARVTGPVTVTTDYW